MHDPGKVHWQAARWILQYIMKTVDVGLKFKKSDKVEHFIYGYVDSNYVGDLNKCRSTTGYILTIARVSVSWWCTQKLMVALSTIEVAMTEAIKETIWLHGLVADLGIEQEHVVVCCDSQSVIHLIKNQVQHSRLKHIDVLFNFICKKIDEGTV